MPTYKVTYFEARGRAELMRLVCVAGDIKYTDERLNKEKDWPSRKPNTPLGQLPLLTVDGVMYPQGLSGARHLAGQAGLLGKTDLEKFQTDVIVDTIADMTSKYYAAIFAPNEDLKVKLTTEFKADYAPRILTAIEKFLDSFGKNSGYFVPSGLSWADLSVFDWFDKHFTVDADALKTFPKLAEHRRKIGSLPKIESWVEKRPVTVM